MSAVSLWNRSDRKNKSRPTSSKTHPSATLSTPNSVLDRPGFEPWPSQWEGSDWLLEQLHGHNFHKRRFLLHSVFCITAIFLASSRDCTTTVVVCMFSSGSKHEYVWGSESVSPCVLNNGNRFIWNLSFMHCHFVFGEQYLPVTRCIGGWIGYIKHPECCPKWAFVPLIFNLFGSNSTLRSTVWCILLGPTVWCIVLGPTARYVRQYDALC